MADYFENFEQPRHVASRQAMASEELLAQREPLMDKALRKARPVCPGMADDEYARACVAALKNGFRYDRKAFTRAYEGLPALPKRHELRLPGQQQGLYMTDLDDAVDEVQEAAPEAFRLWDERGWGSVQGLVFREANGGGTEMLVQCTQTAVARRDPDNDNMYAMSLARVAENVRQRLLFAGACAVVYSDLCEAPGMTLTEACNKLLEEHLTHPVGLEEEAGPCSEASHYHVNWLPYSSEEAKYLAFGLKVPVDILPAVSAAVRLQQPAFEIAEGDDLRLEVVDLGPE